MRVFAAVGFAVVLALAARANAQPAPLPEATPDERDAGYIGKDVRVLEIDDCGPQTGTPEQMRAIGSEHFARGEVLYVQGDYKGAVKELVAAYCIFPYFTILKDIGQAYERELDYEQAIAYLERYVLAVPRDAQKANACAPDPQAEKQNVIARISVLRNLKAKILINTDPPDAKITLTSDTGLEGRGESGKPLEVNGGRYQMLIERDGFKTVTQDIRAEIGKPYTIFTKLEPLKGKLRVRVVPADARLFLDRQQVGTGAYEGDHPGGRYTLSAELSGRVTASREVEVFANRDTQVAFDLPPQPQFGRRQLLGYATFAGAVAGGFLSAPTENGPLITGSVGAGAVAGFVGTFFGAERNIPLGTSSLTISASLIGGTVGGGTLLLFSDDPLRVLPAIGGGLLVGGAVGYYAGRRFEIKPGDAAVINSGALWGTVVGGLFAGSFDADQKVGAGLVLSGLGMGTLGGVLMTRYFSVSRARAALIDVGGVVGILAGVTVESIVTQTSDAGTTGARERTANYTLGGLGAGLLLAGILTRNMDAPALGSVTPVINKTKTDGKTTTTIGIGGSF